MPIQTNTRFNVVAKVTDPAYDKMADHVAEHVAITTAMNVPKGTDPDAFFALVIDKIRAKQDEKIRYFARVRGNER